MQRSRLLIIAACLASALAGCGGGGGHASTPAVPGNSSGSGGTQSGTMSLTFGTQAGATSVSRKPLFVSQNAASAVVDVNNGAPKPFDVSATSSLCQTVSNVRTCTIPLTAPIGQDAIGVALMATVNGTSTMLGQGSNSVNVVAGTNFNLTVGINPVVAGTNAISFSTGSTLSLTLGTAATVTATPIFADPANTPITGSGNVPNFLTPVTITSNDPHVTISPASLTTPGQPFTITYDGSAAVASAVTLTVKSGAATLASATAPIPGLRGDALQSCGRRRPVHRLPGADRRRARRQYLVDGIADQPDRPHRTGCAGHGRAQSQYYLFPEHGGRCTRPDSQWVATEIFGTATVPKSLRA